MSQHIPKVGQAFVIPWILKNAGLIIEDPDTGAYVAGDITAFFGTSATEIALTCTQRGSSPVLDIAISAAQHTAQPILIRIEDRDGSDFDAEILGPFFTNPHYKYTMDDNYAYIKDSGDTVLRHAPVSKVGTETIRGLWVEGPVP